MRRRRNAKGFAPGFTLLEMIAVIVLLGIVSAAFADSLVYGVRNYLSARDATALAQKARLALTRMYVELAEIQGLDPSHSGSIGESAFYYLDHDGQSGSLVLADGEIRMNGQPLVDNVADYGSSELFTYLDENDNSWSTSDGFDALYRITVELRLTSAIDSGEASVFTFTVTPRRTTTPDAPKLE
ncbi:prepilin-type N-terminal cleavage/methylation domain-containing protein [Desulfocurvus sp. DL9XJH121]